jgi:hypothetical protein
MKSTAIWKKPTLWQEGEERNVENRIVLRYH